MMDDLFEYCIYICVLLGLAVPLSSYINAVMAGKYGFCKGLCSSIENTIYKLISVDKNEEMNWKRYLASVLSFSVICFVALTLILVCQGFLPLNPMKFSGLNWDLAFNTAASFVTNTNWQAYSGETTLSYFSQALGLTVQNFVTPAVGMAVLFALMRGIVNQNKDGLGNFFVDVTRTILFILIPFSLVLACINVAQGTPQNFNSYETVKLLEPVGVDKTGKIVPKDDPSAVKTIDESVVPMGPQASQVAIKQLGVNGGGYNGANSASALENPTPLSNICQCISILLIPFALIFSFGRFVKDRTQSRAIMIVVMLILVSSLSALTYFEIHATPQLQQAGNVYTGVLDQSAGNMEGKEARFGVVDSSLWATFTTAASSGSTNASHDSLTPMGGMVTMVLMGIGEIVGGGIGSGLCSMLGFVLLTVFIAGLMVGRTPEYLGKKISSSEMRMATVLCITAPVTMLVGAAILCLDPAIVQSLQNSGSHGFSELFYAAVSAGANNGSAFGGFNANTPLVNIVLALEMIVNRFVPIAASLVLAGSLSMRKKVATSAGTLSTSNAIFIFLLIVVIALIGALSMFPALALGPIAEHLKMMF